MVAHIRVLIILMLLAIGVCPVLAQDDVAVEQGVDHATGAFYRIYLPKGNAWNGSLVLYAPGYTPVTHQLAIPESQMVLDDGNIITAAMTKMGYAFAITSYRSTGLVVLNGIDDICSLAKLFTTMHGQPLHTYLLGVSEGGLVAVLALEHHPELFNGGGLVVSAPIGSFIRQSDYWFDFRVVFDYFFPGIIPGSPTAIPQEVMDDWNSVYAPRIIKAMLSSPFTTEQLLSVTNAPYDRNDLTTAGKTVLGLLWYNVFATNDALNRLGGLPFDNTSRVYHGSWDDTQLNQHIARFSANSSALSEIAAHYETSGQLHVPLVTLYTTEDPIVPAWNEVLYESKVTSIGGSHQLMNYPITRYGHASVNMFEVVWTFLQLVHQSSDHFQQTADFAP